MAYETRIYETLISTEELARRLDDPEWVVVDCRFMLEDPMWGQQEYLRSHISGAVYADLEEDLSGPILEGETGRHPLPQVEAISVFFSGLGIGAGVQVVAYDAAGGSLAAVRLWWLLRWLGHNAAAVLDGGWQRWVAEGRPTRSGREEKPWREFIPKVNPDLLVTVAEVDHWRKDPEYRVFDARLPERYRGEKETVDPVAGHIPGAINAPYTENLTREGVFRSPEELLRYYQELLGDIPPERTAFYCGSGCTSIHNILAAVHAGMGMPRLYAGSWSEWITDPSRPVATGPEREGTIKE
jgi:thiosulfate/3-mercaptopyruvate sulfurtransferase